MFKRNCPNRADESGSFDHGARVLRTTPLDGEDLRTEEGSKRLNEAAAVFSEIMATPDKGIPQELLEKAHCIVIVPELKTGAFIVGGSVGFQIGGSSTDLVMLVMSERGSAKLLESKFTVGAEGSVAAGPVGRTATAQTDMQLHADILSWSRSQRLFAGVALEGARNATRRASASGPSERRPASNAGAI